MWKVSLMALAAVAFWGFLAFEALAVLMPAQADKVVKPMLAFFKPAPPAPMTPAQSAWLDAAHVYDHRHRLCEDLSKARQAAEELRAEQAWSDQPDGAQLSTQLQQSTAFIEADLNAFAECVKAIPPLPTLPAQ